MFCQVRGPHQHFQASRVSPVPGQDLGHIPAPLSSDENQEGQNRTSSTSLPTSPNWFTQIRNASMQQDLPPDYNQLSITRSTTSLQSINHGEIDHISRTCINVRTAQTNDNDMSSLNVNDLEACNSYLTDQEEVEPPTYESLFPENQSDISIDDEINRESSANNQQN